MKFAPIVAFTLGCSLALTGCVKKSVFEEQTKKLNQTQKTLDEINAQLDKTNKELANTNKTLTESLDANKRLNQEKQNVMDDLDLARKHNSDLASRLSQLDQDNEELKNESSRQANENSRLEQELENLRRMRAAAEKQNAQFRTLLEKLRAMIDAGTLKVAIRNGQMIVQLSNDILFAPGGVNLKKEGKEAIVQLAETIREFTDRRFLVVGHSDNAPINTARYPSNWELSSQRAIEVVRILIANGVSEKNLIASGNAEFDPLEENDTPEHKKMNRRVEVVFMPSIEALPTFEDSSSSTLSAETPAEQAAPAAN